MVTGLTSTDGAGDAAVECDRTVDSAVRLAALQRRLVLRAGVCHGAG